MRSKQITGRFVFRGVLSLVVGLLAALHSDLVIGQDTSILPAPRANSEGFQPSEEELAKESSLIEAILDPSLVFQVSKNRSRIVKTALPVTRVAITDPTVVDINEFGPTEIEVVGLKAGETTMTLWFITPQNEERILRYVVEVQGEETDQMQVEVVDEEEPTETQVQIEFQNLEARLRELFPDSRIQLIPIADKLILRGDARDAEEAARIIAIISGQSVDSNGNLTQGGLGLTPVGAFSDIPDFPATKLVNLLRVSGEQQVMLRVRIAEISRSAVREMGVDFSVFGDNFSISNFLGGAGNLSAILDGGDVNLFIRAFSSNGVGKILAEPTLVTLSGKPANFISGGEFAVPTTVGIEGVGAVSTNFYGFGTMLQFTPTVLDKDKIRLQVSPQFSTVDESLSVNGIPGLNTRGASTTVELREGQWLAIAGLIQDTGGGSRNRVPYIGDIPLVGAAFGNHRIQRSETELVILVSPELVHPMEAEQVPLFLPGMDITEPTPHEFFGHQQIEGLPNEHFRSTIWPAYRHQLMHENKKLRAAYRETKAREKYHRSQKYYMSGAHGFSD